MIQTRCPKCKNSVELINLKIKTGVYSGNCPECGKKIYLVRRSGKADYDIKDGQYLRKVQKMKLTKAEKKKMIREKHMKNTD